MDRSVKPFPKKSLLAFARNLTKLRKVSRLTQEEMAERLDVHTRHYQKLEAGTVTPSFGTLVRLRKIFGCGWDDLMRGV